jgi:hypothetical protein
MEFRSQERTDFAYGYQHRQLGDIAEVKILRDGSRQTVKIPLKNRLGNDQLVGIQYDRSPTYYIYGGLVFNPLSINYLQGWGEDWKSDAPHNLVSFLYRNWKSQKGEQIIVLNKVLPSDLNVGYHSLEDEIVVSINGKSVGNIKELIRLIESVEGDYVDVLLASNQRVVFDRQKVTSAGKTILDRYGIPKDRSGDLVF